MSSKEDKKAEKLRLAAEKKAAKEAEKATKKVSSPKKKKKDFGLLCTPTYDQG